VRTNGRHCEELAVIVVTRPPDFVLIESDCFILNESDAEQSSALRHWPRWLVEALVTVTAFWLAYRPLQGRPEALSLALTAMARLAIPL